MADHYINGQVRQTSIIRALGAGLGVIWWLVLSYLFLVSASGPIPAGIVWYPLFVLAEGYSLLRSSGDIFVSGAFRRSYREP